MKTTRIGQEASEATTNLETVKMSIDASAVDHLMSNLTNLYSDPSMAILREYSSNAIDSHVRAKKSAPILITTPTRENDYKLTVQDFGVGMSKDEIANVYSRYGLSTKGASNDEIGGFGLGCKSALAIADRFDIVSVKDGVKTVAFIQKNVKGVGVVHFVSEEPTADANGVTVIIPMGYNNANRFGKADMVRFFIGTPSGSVKLNGEILPTMFDSEWSQLEFGGANVGAYFTGNADWGTTASNFAQLSATVGGVIYKLDNLYNANSELDNFRSEAHNYRIVINLPIGSVDLTPSRESIMITERTNATITATVKDVRQAIIAVVQGKIDSAATMKEAVKTYYTETQLGYWADSFTYRGQAVTTSVKTNKLHHIYRSETDKRKASSHTLSGYINLYEGFGMVIPYVSRNVALFIKGSEADVEMLAKDMFYYNASIGAKSSVNAYVYDDASLADSPVLAEMVKYSTLTANNVHEAAEKYRSDSRKASLAASKAAKENGIVKAKFAALPVWDVDGDGTLVKPTKVEDIFSKPVAYIHAAESITKLRNIFPTLGWHYEQGSVKLFDNNNGTLSVLKSALAGYNVIFLAGQRSLAKFLESYPQVKDAGALVNAYVATFVSDKHDSILAHCVLGTNNYGRYSSNTMNIINMAEGFEKFDMIKNVENKNVRTMLEGALKLKATAGKIDYHVLNNWVTIPDSIKVEAQEVEQSYGNFSNSLILVNEFRVVSNVYAEHMVKYMNMIYPA